MNKRSFFLMLIIIATLCGCENNNNSQVIAESSTNVENNRYLNFFGIIRKPQVKSKYAELGKKLFQDKRLSKNNQLSCESCHSLSKNGADNKALSIGVNGDFAAVNTPTVFNAGYNFRQFWDGRAKNLYEQVEGPVHNPIEMASNWTEVLSKLKQDKKMIKEFNALFKDGITPENIQFSISEFEKQLVTPSKFDLFLADTSYELSSAAKSGLNLFIESGCVSCHQGINVGGNMYQKMGVVDDYFSGRDLKQVDYGRYNVTGKEKDKFYFKVPSLRNVAITAPYFHDGSVETLPEAIRIMFKYQIGEEPTEQEVEDIYEFLKTLTGEEFQY